MYDQCMQQIESRFSVGPIHAGKVGKSVSHGNECSAEPNRGQN